MIPNNITKQHLENAIKEIDEKGRRKGRHSSTYDLVFNNKRYPPKLVISIANRIANGVELKGNEFSGGKGTDAFKLLEENGFIIEEKPKFTWVETHKQLTKFLETKENDQRGLIELLKAVGIGPFDNDKSEPGDTTSELEEIDPFTFFCFIYKYGSKKRLEFLQKISKALNIHYPLDDKGLPSAQAQKVWLFPYKYERQSNEIERLWAFFNKATNNNITDEDFEDVLGVPGTGKTKITEGLFYINPEKYLPINNPTIQYLNAVLNIDEDFSTYSEYLVLLEKIKDKTNLPFYELSNEAREWSTQKRKLKDPLKSKRVENLQYWVYAPGENASHWDEFYQSGIMGLGWDEIGDLRQYETRDQIKNALNQVGGTNNSRRNDVSANDDFLNKIQIGDIVIVRKGRHELLGYGEVLSDYMYDSERKDFQKIRQVKWISKGSWKLNEFLPLKTLTDITDIESKDNRFKFKYEFYISFMDGEIKKNEESTKMNSSLNTIFYGPPGCGKTWRLQTELIPKFTETNINSEPEYYEAIAENISWWETIAVVLLDLKTAKVNEIFDHPLLQAKNRISTTKTPKPTIWSQLQHHTKEDCPNVNLKSRVYPLIFWKSDTSVWSIDENIVNEEAQHLNEFLTQYKNFESSEGTELKRYVFTTFHQSFAYEDFVEGIKPNLEESSEGEISYSIVPGIFRNIVTRAKNDPDHDYAIFIDEINRGNVAAIFGELITLIEKDKRENGDNPVYVKLPYSKDEFCVPSNLYIYGTMNTADRSVEALDSALRRRFTFVEVAPDESVIENPTEIDINLKKLFSSLNSRLEILLDKDHKLGHSYFLEIHNSNNPLGALQLVFKNKVIPLLEEYFYGDLSKIGLVLGEKFISKRDEITYDIWAKGDFEKPDIPDASRLELIDPFKLGVDDYKSIYE